MSQHDDNVFVRNFIIVLGALIGLSIFVFILAQIVTKDLAISDQQSVEARIKPVGQVSTSAAPAAAPAAPKTGKDIYNSVCMACHTAGIAGAPKLGDKPGWESRLVQGQEVIIKNAINGIRGMPARGGRADLSDADVKLAVEYMLAEVGVKPGAAPAVAAQPAAPEVKPATPAEAKPAEVTPPAPAPKPAEAAPVTPPPAPEVKPAEPAPAAPEAKPAAEAAPAAMTTEQVTALMTQKGYACLACHQVETKMVGPAFKEVAAKYKGDATAAAMLAGKIKGGAAGTWGAVPMPPNPTVADDDMKAIVQWVLSLQ